jgi:hypothetical protein
LTFRDYLHRYLKGKPWIKIGIDLIIGSKADKEASLRHQMFLPDRLMSVLTHSNLLTEAKPILTYHEAKKQRSKSPVLTPQLFFVLLAIALMLSTYKKWQMAKHLKTILYALAIIGGLLIIFLWFFTDHQATELNWNLLWLNPMYGLLFFEKLRRPVAYFLLSMILIGCFSYIYPNVQKMHFISIYVLLGFALVTEIVPISRIFGSGKGHT